jgi:hypothetical protein
MGRKAAQPERRAKTVRRFFAMAAKGSGDTHCEGWRLWGSAHAGTFCAECQLPLDNGQEVTNFYPLTTAQAFHEGMRAEGEEEIISLIRSAWAGSQRYAVAALLRLPAGREPCGRG